MAQSALGDAAGAAEAAGGSAGSYAVDASGAYQAASDSTMDARSQAIDQWDDANESYEQTRNQLYEASQTEADAELPDADVPLDAVNHVEAAHTDRLEKAADVETGLVDANADVSAWGNVKAFFSGLTGAAGDAVDAVKGLLGQDMETQDQTDAAAETVFDADGELRSQVDSALRSDARTPDLDPRVSGEYAFEHAGEITSDAAGNIHTP